MAVFGIGAMYGGTDDQTDNFIKMGVACVGWSATEAPAAHAQMASVKVGDIFFIKSFAPTAGLHIKAVGIVTGADFRRVTDALGWGVDVRWIAHEPIKLGPLGDHADYLRRGTIYEEFNPTVLKHAIDKLVPPMMDRVMATLKPRPRPDGFQQQVT